jgi:fumarylacetoacetate (FAA) hydrolase
MRLCLVELEGRSGAVLAVDRGGGLLPLEVPPSVRAALEQFGAEGLLKKAKDASGTLIPQSKVKRWLPPVPDPRTFRDFYAFEQHVKAARARRGQEMIPTWYEIPVFYFSNPSALMGHLEPVKKPASTNELDFELEVACVIGK